MYIPPAFVESDLNKLHDFIENYSFALLMSQVNGRLFGSHLPFLLERNSGPKGCLFGHMARANPQWKEAAGQLVLAIFSGPHAYISPTWYEAEHVVPTWNYIAVHVYGHVEIVEDNPELKRILEQLVQLHEKSMPRPWSFDGAETFIEGLLAQIIGFRIEIEEIEGKWKLNQNHPEERRKKVVEKLETRGDENALAMAGIMEEMISGKR